MKTTLALGLLLFALALALVRHGQLLAVVVLGAALLLTIHPAHGAASVLVACALTALTLYVGTGMVRAIRTREGMAYSDHKSNAMYLKKPLVVY